MIHFRCSKVNILPRLLTRYSGSFFATAKAKKFNKTKAGETSNLCFKSFPFPFGSNTDE